MRPLLLLKRCAAAGSLSQPILVAGLGLPQYPPGSRSGGSREPRRCSPGAVGLRHPGATVRIGVGDGLADHQTTETEEEAKDNRSAFPAQSRNGLEAEEGPPPRAPDPAGRAGAFRPGGLPS